MFIVHKIHTFRMQGGRGYLFALIGLMQRQSADLFFNGPPSD